MTNPELMETFKSRLIRMYNPKVICLLVSFAWGKPDEGIKFYEAP